jgi:arsenate reductase (glutaredoxin)
MQTITVYEKPTCTTCKNLAVLLKDNGIAYDKVNYFIDPLDAAQLSELLKKLGIPAFDLLRRKDPEFKELELTETSSDDEILAAIVANPGLLIRPIVEVGSRAVIARPIERALELIRS